MKKICLLLVLLPVFISAKKPSFTLKLKIFPENYTLLVNGNPVIPEKHEEKTRKIFLSAGHYRLTFASEGYEAREMELEMTHSRLVEEKLEKKNCSLRLRKEIPTGKQPKSVRFTPDGRYLLVPLLNDNGLDVFQADSGERKCRVEFPKTLAQKKGFVETAVCRSRNEVWLAQMHAEKVHVISLDDFQIKTSIDTRGIYSKVIVFSQDESLAFVSNWDSHDITVIDAAHYRFLRKIPVPGIPRGMALSPDGKFLYAALFDLPEVVKIDLANGKIVKTIQCGKAMRHLVPNYEKGILYASSMGSGKIFILSFTTDTVLLEKSVDSKLNTIQLSPDGKFLYVSSRGPNNKESYLLKGPEFGKVFQLDAQTLEIKNWVWGRNQPTGLDVSPDGKTLVFSDFLDQNLEIYQILD